MKYADSLEHTELIERNLKGQFLKGKSSYGKTHGMFGTKFYYKYFAIVQRCNDSKATSYPRYGALGIKNLWTSFEEFRDDMYESYLEHIEKFGERNTTIDRINSKGNYHKENCRWATMKEQARNTKKNHFLTHNGKTQTISAWAEELGIAPELIANRVSRGWPIQNALSTKKFHRYHSGLVV